MANSPENKAWVEQQGSHAASSTPQGMRRLIATEQGRPERQARTRREREGIEIDPQTWAEIPDSGRKDGAPA